MPKIEVDGVELMITRKGVAVIISRIVGRNRKRKRNIRSHRRLNRPEVEILLRTMKRVAALPTWPCTCGYHWGWSDHAEHCRSIAIASDDKFYDD
jgi:hypothetical protein